MFPVASIYTTRHVGGRRWKLETGDRDMCTTPSWPRGRWGPRRDRDEAVVTPRGGLEDRRVLADATSLAELSMGPFCVIRSKPTNQLTDPTQPNPWTTLVVGHWRPGDVWSPAVDSRGASGRGVAIARTLDIYHPPAHLPPRI